MYVVQNLLGHPVLHSIIAEKSLLTTDAFCLLTIERTEKAEKTKIEMRRCSALRACSHKQLCPFSQLVADVKYNSTLTKS